MIHKFKKGDRVVYTDKAAYTHRLGKLGTVVEYTDYDTMVRVLFDGEKLPTRYYDYRLELLQGQLLFDFMYDD